MGAKKQYINAEELNKYSFQLAKKIYDSGYKPECIIGLWRGGSSVALIIHEFYDYKGVSCEHRAIKASYYKGINQPDRVRIEGLRELMENLVKIKKVLIVDDVFDTGNTVKKLLELLGNKWDVKVATVFHNPTNKKVDIIPDFYLQETDRWIVFPHEICGLTEEELKEKNQEVYDIIK
jgi:hypoxanthine phosphoribosyltransferase